MDFWAKTNPRETIQQHTDKLLENIYILKKMNYIKDYKWELLEYAAIYHDMGKMNEKFQLKVSPDGRNVEDNKNNPHSEQEIPHAYLSSAMVPIDYLMDKFDNIEIKILINAIIFHHDRNFDFNEKNSEDRNYIQKELDDIKKKTGKFNYKIIWNDKFEFPYEYYYSSGITRDSLKKFKDKAAYYYRTHILTKGLLHKADYAASAGEMIEYPADFLENSMEIYKNQVLKIKEWNNLQKFMISNRSHNVIAVAQTGYGKTEAGLLWIGDTKGFFTLPIKVAINDIYTRITKTIVTEKKEERVGLAHSDSMDEYIKHSYSDKEKELIEFEGLERYYSRTRLMSLPLTLSTLDQLFLFVFAYRGYELKLAVLSYSKIVIDEIQMYSAELIAYLIIGLGMINNLGGKFAILTATFPPLIEDLLKKECVDYIRSEDYINCEETRHSIKVIEDNINAEIILKKVLTFNKILVICNTIRTAQELYDCIKSCIEEEEQSLEINLLHSGFIKKDRRKKEEHILKSGKRTEINKKEIWIGTQVLEASLDIDFDFLITELSDINGFFQRLGRVYRKRPIEENIDYNCYLYTGKKMYDIRGVGSVIDPDIFKKSREKLLKIDGRLDEKKKLEIINDTYTYTNLKNTRYINDIEDNIEYIKSNFENFLKESEAKKQFRNILSYNIIPLNIYEKNKDKIKKLIETIKNHKKSLYERTEARTELNDFTLSINASRYRKNFSVEYLAITKHEMVLIYDCEYNYEKGFSQKLPSDEVKEEESKFF